MTSTDWAGVLDAFEDHVAAQRALLERGQVEQLRAFVPPQGLGPLPAGLAARARALLLDADALTAAVAQQAAAAQRQISLLSGLRPGETATYVDRSL